LRRMLVMKHIRLLGAYARDLRERATNLGAILPCFWRLVRGAISDIARHTGGYRRGCVVADRTLALGLRRARRANRRDLG